MADKLMLWGLSIIIGIASIAGAGFLMWLLYQVVVGCVEEVKTGTLRSKISAIGAAFVTILIIVAVVMMVVGLLLGGNVD